MIYVFLADGVEEIEAVTTIDILRRAQLDVMTVGVGKPIVKGRSGIQIVADTTQGQISPDNSCSAVVLPGGMPGSLNLERSPIVQAFIKYAKENNIFIAAICAAPSVLGHEGLLNGVKATCFPGFEQELGDAVYVNENICFDQGILTAKGAGVAVEFALRIVSHFCGEERVNTIRASIQCPDTGI